MTRFLGPDELCDVVGAARWPGACHAALRTVLIPGPVARAPELLDHDRSACRPHRRTSHSTGHKPIHCRTHAPQCRQLFRRARIPAPSHYHITAQHYFGVFAALTNLAFGRACPRVLSKCKLGRPTDPLGAT